MLHRTMCPCCGNLMAPDEVGVCKNFNPKLKFNPDAGGCGSVRCKACLKKHDGCCELCDARLKADDN